MRERRNSPPLDGGKSPPPPFIEAGRDGERVTWQFGLQVGRKESLVERNLRGEVCEWECVTDFI